MGRHQGLLGTVVTITTDDPDAEATAVGEIERLEALLSVFRADSDIARWVAGDAAPGPELAALLDLARLWVDRTGGAFDPAAGLIALVWDRAASEDRVPSDEELRMSLERAAAAWPVEGFTLNAIAKGWIVDRAVEASRAEVISLSAGGDLLHRGPEPVVVGIEDPTRPYDNVPPLTRVAVDAALATSGGARRYRTIAGRRWSHVIDPRTGRPVDHVLSASVLAPDACTADVVATALGVLPPVEGLPLADGLGVGCLVIDQESRRWTNGIWDDAAVS